MTEPSKSAVKGFLNKLNNSSEIIKCSFCGGKNSSGNRSELVILDS
ncbi:11377_t:CDS:2 [Dentiscutata erythropus]|uniref:11377_t:CDS:1 n=1 Tax=Dentiscutata erythropus TaxID=1348616 RepID=A0A9N8Z5S7_9GLOM|nr:11377_t:CDS:2 [Dentiscutata erythropus]